MKSTQNFMPSMGEESLRYEPALHNTQNLHLISLTCEHTHTNVIQMMHGSECNIQIWWTEVENVA